VPGLAGGRAMSNEDEPAAVAGAEGAARPAEGAGIEAATTEASAAHEAAGAAAADAGSEGTPGTREQPWWRPRPFSRPLWYPVTAAAAVVALLAGGGMTLLTISRGPQARPLAAGCGVVTCRASLPHVIASPSGPATAVRSMTPAPRRHRRTHQRVLAPTVHSLAGTPAAPGGPPRSHPRHPHGGQPAPPAVTVSYTVDGTDPWHQDFRAHLTIVNHGAAPVAGWNVQVALPGDQVDWVGYPGAWDPFANWQFNGGTLALDAVSGGETIPPGGTEIVPISVQGSNTTPGGCDFNGAACQP
jgi:hypothetical protein